MPYSYSTPDFLQNQSVDEIHQRMLSNLPANIDKSEGQIPWDFTRPAAIEKSMFVQFQLNELVQLIFPQFAYGKWLELHAVSRSIYRRQPNKASGELTVTALPGTLIPAGFQFATPAGLSSSLVFESSAETVFNINDDSVVNDNGHIIKNIPVFAALGGSSGNVAPNSIKLMVKPLSGVICLTNQNALTGGTDEEDDDSLRERVLSAFQSGVSFAGCNADYIRWAKEIPAVGNVVVEPEWDDPDLPEVFHYFDTNGVRKCAGAVRLIVTDTNGEPANDNIIQSIYNHIVSPDDELSRLAPVGAKITVCAPTEIPIFVSAQITLSENQNLETVKQCFSQNLKAYYHQAVSDGSLKYVLVASVLANTKGISNFSYSTLTLNGSTNDISVSVSEFPVTKEVILLAEN